MATFDRTYVIGRQLRLRTRDAQWYAADEGRSPYDDGPTSLDLRIPFEATPEGLRWLARLEAADVCGIGIQPDGSIILSVLGPRPGLTRWRSDPAAHSALALLLHALAEEAGNQVIEYE